MARVAGMLVPLMYRKHQIILCYNGVETLQWKRGGHLISQTKQGGGIKLSNSHSILLLSKDSQT